MKRIGLLVLLLTLACSGSPTEPKSTGVLTARLSTGIQFPGIDFQCDDWCKGGMIHWGIRFNVFGVTPLEHAQIRVYSRNAFGDRRFLGVAHDTGNPVSSSSFRFDVEGVAPADSIPDIDGAGTPPWYGRVPLEFDVYIGPRHKFVGTGGGYSDIPLIDNFPGHACVPVKRQPTQ